MKPKDRIIVPLDVSSVEKARDLVDTLAPFVGGFKIGLEFIYSNITNLLLAPESIAIDFLKQLRALARKIEQSKILWDGKFADIPNTIKGASLAVSKMGAMFNIHASCGRESVRAAIQSKGECLVFGVTVLTSINEEECRSIFGDNPGNKVVQFAKILEEEGADGIICSPQELKDLQDISLIKATPGVRPEWAQKGDQSRVTTPYEAVRAGADYLIIGRPIRQPDVGSSEEAAQKVAAEIETALLDQQEKG